MNSLRCIGLALLLSTRLVGLPAAPIEHTATGKLGSAWKSYDEKSYQLAVQSIDEISTSTLPVEQQREATYLRSMCAMQLGRYGEAKEGLISLVQNRAEDLWAGRAHWKLQPGMPPYGYQVGDTDSTDSLRHLRRAEAILTKLHAPDLEDFYRQVAFEGLGSIPAYGERSEKDRAYLYSFFDKLIALLKDEEKIAEAQLRRTQQINYVKQQENWEAEQLHTFRQIVKEFPRTVAAARAQLQVAQYFLNRSDFVKALPEFELVVQNWPGSEEAKQAAASLGEIKRPEVIFRIAGPVLPDSAVTFTLAARNTGDIRLTAIPFDPIETLKSQRQTRLELKSITGATAASQVVSVKKRADYRQTTAAVEFRVPKAGLYVLRAEADGASCYGLLLSTNLALISNNNGISERFWVVDAKSGRPRGGASITVAHDAKNEHRMFSRDTRAFNKFTKLTADTSGFADFVPGKAPDSGGEILAVARDGDNYGFIDNQYWSYYPNEHPAPQVYFYTDRPVYRPKQKVYWRAIIRDRNEGNYSFDRNRRYNVEIYDPKSARLILFEKKQLNEFGALAGELELADGAPLGQYRVDVRQIIPGAYQRVDGDSIGTGSFRVEEYKKPEYEVKVTAGKDVVRAGGKVTADVSAQYYFGGAVGDAEIKYTVRRRPRYSFWWDCMLCGFGGNTEDLGWFDASPKERGPMHNSGGDIVSTGNGKTDVAGKYQVAFTAELPPEPQSDDNNSGDIYFPFRKAYRGISRWYPWRTDRYDFQVEVTVTDKSRRNIDGSATVVVGRKALDLSVRVERYLVTPGDVVKATLGSRNLNDQPVATSGTLYVEKLKWNPARGKDDITTISTQQVDISASGTLRTQWRVPPDQVGRMRFLFIAPDPFGESSIAGAEFFVAGPGTEDVFTRYQGLELISDKTIYNSGDKARIMILSEFKDAVAWYWIDSGSGNIDKRVLPLPHRTNFVDIPITDAFSPDVQVHVVAVQNQKMIEDSLELLVPPKKKVLTVTVAGDKPDYRPGEEGQFEITAVDFAGKPVRTEFSLSMFDSAILYIAPESRVDIRRALFGERRQLRAEIRNSMPSAGQYLELVPENQTRFLSTPVERYETETDEEAIAVNGATLKGLEVRRDFARVPAAAAAPIALGATAAVAGDMQVDMFAAKKLGEFGLFDEAKDKSADQLVQPKLRTDFRDSMFWSPAVITDEHGRATVRVKFPDSLTTWKCTAVGTTADTVVGNFTTETVVRKNLLARLEAPRFFRQRDQVTLSGVIHNYLPDAQDVQVSLATGDQLKSTSPTLEALPGARTYRVEPNAETRVDWTFDVVKPGETSVTLRALTSAESDAVEMSFPVLQHGIDKFVAWNGTTVDPNTTEVSVQSSDNQTLISRVIELPKERIVGTSKLTITVNPSLAFAIRDALPYMIEYPYGCTEQTMSRFMPAAVAQHAFRELHLPPDPIAAEKLSPVIAAGLQRLHDFQHGGGGWGWWRDDDDNPYMTAYVMYGLTIVRQADVSVDQSMFSRGLQRLHSLVLEQLKHQKEQQKHSTYWWPYDLHSMMFAEFVLALNGQSEASVLDFLFENRDKLSAHGLAMLARSLWHASRQEDARTIVRNMHNVVVITPENGTARWGKLQGGWYWWEEAVEATAMGLMAHLEIDPSNPLVDQSMKWLVLNRKGHQWKSTKDTAHSVLALSTYMLQRKEEASSMDVRIWLSDADSSTSATGPELKRFTVSPDNFWSFNGSVVLRGNEIPECNSGRLRLSIEKKGSGTAFYSAFAEYFTLEEHIKRAGNEIYVERTYEKLVRDSISSATQQKPRLNDEGEPVPTPTPDPSIVANDRYVPVHEGDTVVSGDELRVTLRIKSLNDYEYLVFEDPKPAGMEPVQLQSGTTYADGLCSNMELRDQHVAFFITHLPQGERSISYNVRAETPGTFHTMPTTGYAMYFPPLRTNSDELVIKVVDK